VGYAVKEIFYSIQGEGANVGSPAVFCRFAGCNLWSGREADRAGATCTFCDTDFIGTDGVGGGLFESATKLAGAIRSVWGSPDCDHRFVILTGGEPALQIDSELIAALHEMGFWIAIETNGTIALPAGIDWVCVSPKVGTSLKVQNGDELKVVYPQIGMKPTEYESLRFSHFFLQPRFGADTEQNTQLTIRYCLENPKWRLSLQTHKMLNIP
jgi:7-carboxy-7-deazaguanine synthase (Cx14CxxC type)